MPDDRPSFEEMVQVIVAADRAGELRSMPDRLKRVLYESVYAGYDWWKYIRSRDVELEEKED